MPSPMVHICQGGCGTFEADGSKMHTRGMVNERSYCERCVAIVDEYLADRDALHTRLSQDWSNGMAVLAETYADRIKHLPDGG